jgi:hypothetical protein
MHCFLLGVGSTVRCINFSKTARKACSLSFLDGCQFGRPSNKVCGSSASITEDSFNYSCLQILEICQQALHKVAFGVYAWRLAIGILDLSILLPQTHNRDQIPPRCFPLDADAASLPTRSLNTDYDLRYSAAGVPAPRIRCVLT